MHQFECLILGNEATLESTGAIAGAHIRSRLAQARAVAMDMSAFIPIGVALGVLTKKYDGWAPDAGVTVGYSCNDLSTHGLALGATGTGKTSNFIRPNLAHWLGYRKVVVDGKTYETVGKPHGGALILDAKYALPAELKGLKDYILIEPGNGVQLALLEGLSPNDVVTALDVVAKPGLKSDASNKGSAAFFIPATQTLIFNLATMLRSLADIDIAEHGEGSERRTWVWTWRDLRNLLIRAQGGNPESKEVIKAAVERIKTYDTDALKIGVLSDALEYVSLTLPNLPDETRGNIFATAGTWIDPIFQHKKMEEWTACEKGVDLSEVLRGRVIGVSSPSMKYGVAGTIVQAMVKQRAWSAGRGRADRPNWRQEGEQPFLMVVDEAAHLVGKVDLEALQMGRSLGVHCCFASQMVENFVVQLGGVPEASSLLENFRTVVMFKSSPDTRAFMQKRLGTTRSLVFNDQGGGIDYGFTGKIASEGPLNDPKHAGRRYFRSLRRRGAGGVRVIRHGKLVAHGSTSHHDEDSGSLMTNPVRNGQWVTQPLLTDSEIDAYTAELGCAVVEVQRGGVRRRDVVMCQPMDKFPAILLGESVSTPPESLEPTPFIDTGVAEEGGDGSSASNPRPSALFNEATPADPIDLSKSREAVNAGAPFTPVPDAGRVGPKR